MEKTRKKEDLNIPVMIVCIIGVVLAVFGFLLLETESFKLRVISTEGTVAGVQTKKTADGVIASRSVNLSYTVNNASYNATIANYTEDITIGDKMTLYYDFITPESISDKRTGYVGYLALILGAIFILKTGPRFVRIIKDNYL